ncbi:MAG TPA: nitrate- and nitrite sensing domain-containing protein [Actinomycetota bacterium]|nr:nitrate- and nitrite sensing domain-containing protein [Actinomycetota bacterium]
MFGNLSIRPKMVVLLAVPVAATALLGVTGVAGAWGDRARAAEERREAAVAGQALVAVHELQEERVRAVAWAAGEGGQGELGARRRRVDSALAAYRAGAAGLGPTGEPALDRAVAAAAERLDRLAVVRAEVDQRLVDPERASATHDALVSPLLGVARGLAAHLDTPVPARTARLLLAVTTAKEATGQERTLLAGTRPSVSSASTRVRLAAAAAVARHEIEAVRAAAGERLAGIDRALGAAAVRTLRDLELRLLQPDPDLEAARDLEAWRDGLAVRTGVLRRLERAVAGDLDAAVLASLRQRERRLRDRLVLAGVVVLATLVAASALLRGLAGRGRSGAEAGAAVPGLARRSQALADRQLQLLDDLTRDEPDPQRRQGLLGVDHLATRLRRTAETLLAVTGPGPARHLTRPLPISTLVRAAIAEAEPGGSGRQGAPAGRGRRVEILTTGDAEMAGAAGIDLVHLLAELLDNAVAFSPPTAPIVVTGGADGDGYLIEVTDRGFGMSSQEQAWANHRLAAGGGDPGDQAADRLGLLVVARLARRNGFRVRLRRSGDGGVTAAVRLPAAQLSALAPAPVRAG